MKKAIALLAVAATLVTATAPARADDRVVQGAIIGAILGAVVADASRPRVHQPAYPVYDGYPQQRPVYDHRVYDRPCQVYATRGHHSERIVTDCSGRVLSVEPIRRGGHYHRY